jgi:gluconate 2-dehydrogenase gamma chain
MKTTLDRRDILKLLASAPLAAGFVWTEAEAHAAYDLAQAAQSAANAGKSYVPKFFTPHEWQTVRVLVDLIIPRDERSGSATDAGVPEFMDFMMLDQPTRQVAMRGGLAWLDLECQKRFDKRFLECDAQQRKAVLDDIAWPARSEPPTGRAVGPVLSEPGNRRVEGPVLKEQSDMRVDGKPELRHGIAFFNSFRDLTATGFWTSRMGIDDLQYMGNRSVARWSGCPEEALKKLGVSYSDNA